MSTRRKIAETRLSLQYAIAKALSEAKTHEQGVMRVLRVMGTILGWETGMLWKVDDGARLLRCDKIWQAPTFSAPAFITASLKETFALGLGLPGRVWVSRKPIWLTDVTKMRFHRRAKVAAREGLHSAFAFPLCLGDEVLGVVEFYSRSTHLSDRNLLKVLVSAGSQIGQFIERKRVEAEQERLLIEVENERYRSEQLAIEAERRASELDAVFMAMSDPLLVYDADGITVSANPAAVALYGFSPVGKDRQTLIKQLSLSHFEGRLVKVEEVPSTQALQGKAAVGEYLSLVNAKGENLVVSAVSSPVMADGKILGAVSMFHDVSEHVQLEKQKDSFIATASHELKTPVTILQAYSQILQKRFQHIHDQEALHYLAKMNLQLDKITDLVADLLDVTRIRAGTLVLHRERFNLDKLIDEVIEDVHNTAEGYQIIKKGETAGEISGDRDRLGQVLTNLLSNAVKYSPGGKVIVRTKKDKDKLTVSVKDFGVGISVQDQKKVFDRFYRVNGKEETRFSGLGLGLFISSEIIKQHGGKIGVKSKESEGSTFFFDLPFKK